MTVFSNNTSQKAVLSATKGTAVSQYARGCLGCCILENVDVLPVSRHGKKLVLLFFCFTLVTEWAGLRLVPSKLLMFPGSLTSLADQASSCLSVSAFLWLKPQYKVIFEETEICLLLDSLGVSEENNLWRITLLNYSEKLNSFDTSTK